MEAPPLIPDHRADAVLDACPTFESRRAAVSWHVSDLIAAAACLVVAIALVAWL
jgi:hypothetical protein